MRLTRPREAAARARRFDVNPASDPAVADYADVPPLQEHDIEGTRYHYRVWEPEDWNGETKFALAGHTAEGQNLDPLARLYQGDGTRFVALDWPAFTVGEEPQDLPAETYTMRGLEQYVGEFADAAKAGEVAGVLKNRAGFTALGVSLASPVLKRVARTNPALFDQLDSIGAADFIRPGFKTSMGKASLINSVDRALGWISNGRIPLGLTRGMVEKDNGLPWTEDVFQGMATDPGQISQKRKEIEWGITDHIRRHPAALLNTHDVGMSLVRDVGPWSRLRNRNPGLLPPGVTIALEDDIVVGADGPIKAADSEAASGRNVVATTLPGGHSQLQVNAAQAHYRALNKGKELLRQPPTPPPTRKPRRWRKGQQEQGVSGAFPQSFRRLNG